MSRRRSRKQNNKSDITYLNNIITLNGVTTDSGATQKNWTIYDIKGIKAMTPNQHDMFEAFFNDQNICALGYPGTGKTFCAMYLAFIESLDKKYPIDHVKVIRSVVPTREVGHLPGTLAEKTAVFEAPYRDICMELFGKSATWENMKQRGIVSFESTSFLRGVTWDNTMVIVDECQNLTWHELNTVVTRLGTNSKIILVGDIQQDDLNKKHNDVSGIRKMTKVCEKMNEFSVIQFSEHDIIRSPFVKSWIITAQSVKE